MQFNSFNYSYNVAMWQKLLLCIWLTINLIWFDIFIHINVGFFFSFRLINNYDYSVLHNVYIYHQNQTKRERERERVRINFVIFKRIDFHRIIVQPKNMLQLRTNERNSGSIHNGLTKIVFSLIHSDHFNCVTSFFLFMEKAKCWIQWANIVFWK